MNFFIKRVEVKPGWNAIFKSFSIQVWLATVITMIILVLILPPIINYELNRIEGERRWTLKTSFWFLFSSFTNQGSEISNINRLYSRIAIGTCSVTVLILTFSYSGTLTSHLTAPSLEPVPKTFQELADAVKKGKIACGTRDSSAVYTFIMTSNIGFVKDLKEHIVANNNFFGFNDMMPRAKKGNIALISYGRVIKSWTNADEEKWFISDDSLSFLPFAFIMRKGFPLKHKINTVVTRLLESGITNTVLSDISNKNEKMESGFQALSLFNFLGAFWILVAGYSLAIICFIFELLVRKRSRAVLNHTDC
ncbi:glutamate receptor ionotropic, delta-1-like [Centruroides vittatus]|uniref:glutamate receptor ionotropic, delta-1-like n=1 Tax=Centruroides vittatus TaxID=120091 RepID=UPI003510B47A